MDNQMRNQNSEFRIQNSELRNQKSEGDTGDACWVLLVQKIF